MSTVSEPDKRVLELEFVKDRVDHLPVMPSVIAQLKQLSHDSVDFYAKVAVLAQHYPPLAARILNYAHSSPAPLKPTYSCEHALERIGIFKTLELMKALEEIQFVEPARQGVEVCWRHSVETARICQLLAEHTPGFGVNSDLAYICGLLHDIGRLVLLQIPVQDVEVLEATGWDSPEELNDLEEQVFGFNHADVGYLAARQWNLPHDVTQILRYHHDYNFWQNERLSLYFRKLLILVQFADALSILVIKNPEWPAWSEVLLKGSISECCIQKSWPDIAFPIELLTKELPRIVDLSEKVTDAQALYSG
ncbi:HDOD domain-containing protein [Amphritea atlantica]|uniref:HDOD domain-containing protein n=1 Tax=Amphritea atlantica TaxID=355243 RepID=A0ABY5GRB6_9GAMM|nr:HDOD domain-containing protein [Amphritea atlantica]